MVNIFTKNFIKKIEKPKWVNEKFLDSLGPAVAEELSGEYASTLSYLYGWFTGERFWSLARPEDADILIYFKDENADRGQKIQQEAVHINKIEYWSPMMRGGQKLPGVFGFLQRLKRSQGSALIPVLIAAVCIGLLLGLGYHIIQEAIRTTNLELSLKGQVYNVAASGISESLSWFRSRRFQPVKRFEPKSSEYAVGGEKGLIRNFEVSKSAGLWGRFSVGPDLVKDITDLRGRGKKGDGLVWRIRSEGILFINRDPSIPYNKAPNKIIHRLMLMTEIQRLKISPPANSALLTENGSEIEILDGGRVRGFEGAALTFRQGTGKPNISIPAEVTSHGSNRINLASKKAYRLDIPHVFGVTWRELQELADILVEDTSMLPPELPRMAIIVMEKDAIFNHDRPLIGGGILIVDGNLQIEANSNSNFSGLIYCRGSFVMDAPALISGTVISLGEVRLQGFGDFAEIQYNGDFLGFLKQRLGQYRQTQALIQVKG